MRDQKYQTRLSALKLWADMVSARGYVPPAEEDLSVIAEHKKTDTPGLDQALVGPWRDALKELLKQLAFNIADPHLQLGMEFDEPGPGAVRVAAARSPKPAPATGGAALPAASPAADPAFLALKTWRNKAIAEKRLSPSNLKEAQLRLLVNSGQTTEVEIRSAFPPAVAKYAGEMASVLTGLHSAGETVEAASRPKPAPRDPAPSAHPRAATPQPAAAQTAPMRAAAPAPTKAPVADKAPTPTAPSTVGLDPAGFAAYDYGPQTPAQVHVEARRDSQGHRTYSWTPAQSTSPVTIYRLVAGDEHEPYAPDQADLVAVTTAAEAMDERPFTTATRYLQVWLNEGPSIAEAMAAQPTLYAGGGYVGELGNVEIREDEGRVVGRWTALPGTQKVQIFRIPLERAATGGGDQRYRILQDSTNLGGFVDAEAERGKAYLYQVCAEAALGGDIRLSSPTACTIRLSAVLEPVTDMCIAMTGDNESSLFDLRWSSPAGGTVVVYRTEQPPQAGLELEPLSEDSLRISGLMPETRLSNPVEVVDGTATMLSIPWPSGWTRAYFTPVTLLEGMAHVGTAIFKSRNEKVRNPRIVERVNSQILSFEWPDGADSVMVYMGPTGQDPELSLNSQAMEISQPDYRRRGGLQFTQPLPSTGCDLHLVPVSFEAGARVSGAITTVNYPHILRLNYQVVEAKSFLGKVTGVSVIVQTSEAVQSMPAFVLVYHPDRLPLTSRDGTALNMVPAIDVATTPARRFTPGGSGPDGPVPWKTDAGSWASEVNPEGGFLRLFADLPVDVLRHVALLDPPVASLRFSGTPGMGKRFFGGR
ncbi:hypothetical protein [Pseudarthrobacter sulfonivorans]|uniref:hypothetical protein n=1 Tax=Pseudarthrobacter sulfonivorans TaxID=121292 RepID=UPI00168B28DE|nr:hypothetical protein [Pseudarthrobacter sulfonivorans]